MAPKHKITSYKPLRCRAKPATQLQAKFGRQEELDFLEVQASTVPNPARLPINTYYEEYQQPDLSDQDQEDPMHGSNVESQHFQHENHDEHQQEDEREDGWVDTELRLSPEYQELLAELNSAQY